MPTRLLRDCTDSEKINLLDGLAERFFYRLIMIADDYGRYYAHPGLLKARMFPFLLEKVREADISRWITECEKAGLIALYEHSGKKYLHILDFRQRLDKAKEKFPGPPSLVNGSMEVVNDFPSEAEREAKQEADVDSDIEKRRERDSGTTHALFSKIKIEEAFVQQYPTYVPGCFAKIDEAIKGLSQLREDKEEKIKEKFSGVQMNEKIKILLEKFNADMIDCDKLKLKIVSKEVEKFFSYYDSRGWKHSNGNKIHSLTSTVKNWLARKKQFEKAS